MAFKIDTQQFVQSLLDIGEDLAATDNSRRGVEDARNEDVSPSGVETFARPLRRE